MATLRIVAVAALLTGLLGCAGTPLTYLASEKPAGPIRTAPPGQMKLMFTRSYSHWGNSGSSTPPAADVGAYVRRADREVKGHILRNADVHVSTPFYVDLLFYSHYSATDEVITSNW